MQAVIRRTVLAERQAARRLMKRRTKNHHEEMKTRREHERFAQQHLTGSIKNARTARREDYDLGPLAPRRDVGLKKETYGTIHSNQLHGQKLTMEERMEVNPSGGRYANIVAGDRVVVLEGVDKGRIGKVQSFDAEKQQITVEGMNMVCRSDLSSDSGHCFGRTASLQISEHCFGRTASLFKLRALFFRQDKQPLKTN